MIFAFSCPSMESYGAVNGRGRLLLAEEACFRLVSRHLVPSEAEMDVYFVEIWRAMRAVRGVERH